MVRTFSSRVCSISCAMESSNRMASSGRVSHKESIFSNIGGMEACEVQKKYPMLAIAVHSNKASVMPIRVFRFMCFYQYLVQIYRNF